MRPFDGARIFSFTPAKKLLYTRRRGLYLPGALR